MYSGIEVFDDPFCADGNAGGSTSASLTTNLYLCVNHIEIQYAQNRTVYPLTDSDLADSTRKWQVAPCTSLDMAKPSTTPVTLHVHVTTGKYQSINK